MRKTLVLLLALTVVPLSTVWAYDNRSASARHDDDRIPDKYEDMEDRMVRDLNLSEAQESRFRDICDDKRDRLEALREDYRDRRKAIREDADRRVTALLNAEQKRKYQKMTGDRDRWEKNKHDKRSTKRGGDRD